mmetsp:Transcript_6296/g.12786  ORF Transcript_6296/g.12786 Transcript_6296/m.12786 type:complete len:97 (-) Transcript_6296:110-400(-)
MLTFWLISLWFGGAGAFDTALLCLASSVSCCSVLCGLSLLLDGLLSPIPRFMDWVSLMAKLGCVSSRMTPLPVVFAKPDKPTTHIFFLSVTTNWLP